MWTFELMNENGDYVLRHPEHGKMVVGVWAADNTIGAGNIDEAIQIAERAFTTSEGGNND